MAFGKAVYHRNRNKTRKEIGTKSETWVWWTRQCFSALSCVVGKGGRFLKLSARMSTEFSKISGLCCRALANNNTKENADNGGLGYEFLEEGKGFHEGHLCGVLD